MLNQNTNSFNNQNVLFEDKELQEDVNNLSKKLQESTLALNKIEEMLQKAFNLIDTVLSESKNHISNDKHLEFTEKKDALVDNYFMVIGNKFVHDLQSP